MGKHGGDLAAFWRPAITSSVHTHVPEALRACPRSHPGHQHNSRANPDLPDQHPDQAMKPAPHMHSDRFEAVHTKHTATEVL